MVSTEKIADNTIKQRLLPSGLNSDFTYQNLSFAEYISTMRDIIEKTRHDVTPQNRELIIDANSPYEWIPEAPEAKNAATGKIRNGILLIHGLFDSPHMLYSIAQHFMAKNFLVRTILLPGHGTIPGDLLNTHYAAWVQATDFGVNSFTTEVENLYIAGFSTGGALALNHAYYNPMLKGLILFAPAIKLRRQFAIISNINHLMTRTVGGIKWYTRGEDNDYAKYHSHNFNSAHQVYLLTKKIAEEHNKTLLKTPVFMALSEDDEVLDSENSIAYFKSLPTISNRMYFYNDKQLTFDDPRIHSLNSTYPNKNILNFSHVCLPIAPEHPHYGEQGDYIDTAHFGSIYGKYYTNKNPMSDQIYLGAIKRENLKKYNLRRLTYNPDFNSLMARVDDFLIDTATNR